MVKRGREGHCCCYCCWCWHVLTRAGLAYEWARHRRTKQVKSKSSRRKPTAQPRHARTHTHAHRDCEREGERTRDGQRARHAGRQALTRIGRMIRQESLLRGGRRRTRRRRRRRWKRRRQALRRSLYMRLFLHPLSTAAHTNTHTHTCRLSGLFGHARITKAATQTTTATSMTFDTESMGGWCWLNTILFLHDPPSIGKLSQELLFMHLFLPISFCRT